MQCMIMEKKQNDIDRTKFMCKLMQTLSNIYVDEPIR